MKTKQLEKEKPKLNEVIITETIRADGSRRIQQGFENCPTMAEQHTAHLSDINWLMKKYKPDELAAYMAARAQYRQEIKGHDFSQEPSMQDALNIVYRSKQAFEELDEDIKSHFLNHVEFLKFIDNPENEKKMIKLGILTPKQVENLKTDTTTTNSQTPTTQEEKDKKK